MIDAAMFGVLTRDASSKVTSKSGKRYLQLNLRVGDSEPATWINAMVFDHEAIEAAAAGKMVKGTKVYLEGRLSLDEWTAGDGSRRHGLSVMARYCRVPQIGRNRPKKPRKAKAEAPTSRASLVPDPDLSDAIPDLGTRK